jgi:hypothetical protein
MRRALLLWSVVGLIQCGSRESPTMPTPAAATFQVRACRGSAESPDGEIYRVRVHDAGLIARARALIGATGADRRLVYGVVAAGDGGFNAPWSWHLDPQTIAFPGVVAEILDGCPRFLEADLDAAIGKGFAPWTSEVLAEDRSDGR